MTVHPVLSVIVPVFNAEKHLAKCLDSILNQTYQDIELILVNDGSTDNSKNICELYLRRDSRIKLINIPNSGASKARNTGLDAATGEFITFVDSDDYLEKDIYSEIIGEFADDIDIVMFGVRTVDTDGITIKEDTYSESILTASDIIAKVISQLNTAVWNKVFRSKILKGTYFPEEFTHNEDMVFICRSLTTHTVLKTVIATGYYYVKHPGTVTSRPFSLRSFDEIKAKDNAASIIESKFPEQAHLMEAIRIRGRMNVLRRMAKLESNEMLSEKNEIKRWLRDNFKAKEAGWKLRIYYFILTHDRLNKLVFGRFKQ